MTAGLRAPDVAIILAGGRSSRMGRSKASLDWDGTPLLRRMVEALGTASGRVVVVRAAGQELPPAAAVADVQAVLRRLWKVKWSNFAYVPFLFLTLDGWPTAARLGKVDDRCVCGEAQCPDRAHVLFDCPGAGRGCPPPFRQPGGSRGWGGWGGRRR